VTGMMVADLRLLQKY